MRAALALLGFVFAVPATAQEMDHSHHHMEMPATAPEPAPAAADPHAGHHMPAPAPVAPANAPAPPTDHAADRFYSPTEMAAARAQLYREHGAMPMNQVMIDIAEIRPGRHGDAYAWEGEAWIGGDIDRLVLKSEGEGSGRLERAEAQALWSRALDPYWNLQAGIRHDVRPRAGRTYATIGVEGLAPYWFKVEASIFLSNKGDLLARVEGYHDLRLTQRLILQPRIEIELATSDDRATGVGSGLSRGEAALRLRYEIDRRFAPYLGVIHERRFGRTGRFAVADGEDRRETRAVIGVRTWF